MNSYKNVDEYIANFPSSTQDILQKVRGIIRKSLPDATEKISYGIPTYWRGRNLVHFGGYDKHISLYPGSVGVEAFANDLKDYETSKGTIKFPLDKPIPYDLIETITLYCGKNNS